MFKLPRAILLLFFTRGDCNAVKASSALSKSKSLPSPSFLESTFGGGCLHKELPWSTKAFTYHKFILYTKFENRVFVLSAFKYFIFKFGTTELWEEHIVKLLGVHIDKNLTFTNHLKTLCKNASRKHRRKARGALGGASPLSFSEKNGYSGKNIIFSGKYVHHIQLISRVTLYSIMERSITSCPFI